MEIQFAGGRTLKFRFPVQAKQETAAQWIGEALKLPTLTISADEKPYAIPTNTIQTIPVSPAPRKPPRTVIRGTTLE
jgi:hypothetical protein